MQVIYRVDRLTGDFVAFFPTRRVKYSGTIKCYKKGEETEEILRYYVLDTKAVTGDISVFDTEVRERYGDIMH